MVSATFLYASIFSSEINPESNILMCSILKISRTKSVYDTWCSYFAFNAYTINIKLRLWFIHTFEAKSRSYHKYRYVKLHISVGMLLKINTSLDSTLLSILYRDDNSKNLLVLKQQRKYTKQVDIA